MNPWIGCYSISTVTSCKFNIPTNPTVNCDTHIDHIDIPDSDLDRNTTKLGNVWSDQSTWPLHIAGAQSTSKHTCKLEQIKHNKIRRPHFQDSNKSDGKQQIACFRLSYQHDASSVTLISINQGKVVYLEDHNGKSYS